jgi:hypothetical protein
VPFAWTRQGFAARALLVAFVVCSALTEAQVLLALSAAVLVWAAVLCRDSVASLAAGSALELDLAWCPDSVLDSGSDLALALHPDSAVVAG